MLEAKVGWWGTWVGMVGEEGGMILQVFFFIL